MRTPRIAFALAVISSLVACEGAMTSTPVDDAAIRIDAHRADGAIAIDGGDDLDGSIGPGTDAQVRDDGSIVVPDVDARVPEVDGGPTGVPIFVAQGYMQRSTISCDDGRTWIANRSTDDATRCFGTGGPDCDHNRGRAKGIVYSHGWFVATWGWGGEGGDARRSRDGVTWETTLADPTFGGIAVSESSVLLGARNARVSDDDGATWSDPIATMLSGWNVRRAGYAGGRMILVGDGGDVTLSSDEGETWWKPTTIPGACGAGIQNEGGIAEIGGAIVIVGGNGVACRSTDGGVTFTEHATGTGDVSSGDVISTGTELMFWAGDRVFRSTNGSSWTSQTITPSTARIGAVERSPSGTFVAVRAGWNEWYERQRWYRSTDGITWEELPESAAARSHPVLSIAWGIADPSACD